MMAKILIVDDSASMLALLEQMLREENYTVTVASSGAKALEILGRESLHLVITDIYMPPPDGLEVMRLARALKLNVPFIAISSQVSPQNKFIPARGLGAQISLQKPFSREQLIEAVEAVLAENMGSPFRQLQGK
jgi:DNA-binding response OmpR family regulator